MDGIRVEGLARRFGARTAVEGLTFEVGPGEVFGLLGPNGAGKTTTVRMLAGLLRPTEGRATVCGLSVTSAGDSVRKVVGLLTEQPGLYDRLTARENLEFYIKLNELDQAAAWRRAAAYLERFGLGGREDDPAGSLSKGMRQKLAIVRALVHDPKVLFLDEPTSGLDPASAKTVRDAIAELAAEGRTLVLCSHNLPEVERLCQRVAVIRNRLVAVSKVKELRRHGSALTVQLGGEAAPFTSVIQALAFAPACASDGSVLRVMLEAEDHAPEVIAALVRAGARIHSAVPSERPLEEVYLELVKSEGAEV